MNSLTNALRDYLSSDKMLAGKLSLFSGSPAVFVVDSAPAGATFPYVIVTGNIESESFDTKTSVGINVSRELRCYVASTGSIDDLEFIADRVRSLLHRYPILVDGYTTLTASAAAPKSGPETEGMMVRTVAAKYILMEN